MINLIQDFTILHANVALSGCAYNRTVVCFAVVVFFLISFLEMCDQLHKLVGQGEHKESIVLLSCCP